MPEPGLHQYRAKRRFEETPEPAGVAAENGEGSRWVVQQHAARRMHYDFRLESNGVLISWAVPKGPSYNPAVKRLAVKVEDHPLDYRDFEGSIPGGNYGAGSVIVWDEGTYRNLTSRPGVIMSVADAVEAGHVSFWLEGKKLIGGWSLTRFDGDNWALVKMKDERSDSGRDVVSDEPGSVKTGRTVQEVGREHSGEARTDATVLAPGTLFPASYCPPMLAGAGPRAGAGQTSPLADPLGTWLFEPKLDGLRCIAVRNGDDVALFSRNRLSFNARFPAIAEALRSLPATNFVLDGELVALVDGRPDFAALQHGQAALVEYRVFDLPWLLGRDLRHLAIEDRKYLLAKTVPESEHLKVVTPLPGAPQELFEQVCRQGWEGLVAKRAGSVYREGRSGDWRKLKCGCRQELVVGGFTEPRGSRQGLGALVLGYWERGELVYAGKVGTGFTQSSLDELRTKLASLERSSSPFGAPVPERGAHWVEPQLVAEVAFSNWTPDGRLRHPSFLGLRPDKPSEEVGREDWPSPGL